MALHDLDLQNFERLEPNKSARYVISVGQNILAGVEFDSISVAYPNATTEIFTYYAGGLSGTLNATVTVVYTDATKEDVSTVERT